MVLWGHGQTEQGWGEVETNPALVSVEQHLVLAGAEIVLGPGQDGGNLAVQAGTVRAGDALRDMAKASKGFHAFFPSYYTDKMDFLWKSRR